MNIIIQPFIDVNIYILYTQTYRIIDTRNYKIFCVWQRGEWIVQRCA